MLFGVGILSFKVLQKSLYVFICDKFVSVFLA